MEDPSRWTVDQVGAWLKKIGLGENVGTFKKEGISGDSLFELTIEDLKGDLGLNLGNRKIFERERAKLKNRDQKNIDNKPQKQEEEKQQKEKEFTLLKGLLGVGQPFTFEQLDHIRLHQFEPTSKQWVKRDIPLNIDELECWNYQACWLNCPITGRSWFNRDTILGVGIYHAPRFLSDLEKQRELNDIEQATLQNEPKKKILNAKRRGDISWDKDFVVYPHVLPPPEANIVNIGRLSDDVNMGYVEVIVGPVFDIQAYNQGITGNNELFILPKNKRGVLSMDQQYNALNFEYHVLRAQDSFQRKRCTNRLSFFIEERHGNRVFPQNIESQLSLLVFRDQRICEGGKTNQNLLAIAIKKAIPRILRAVVMEVVKGRSTGLDERIDHAIRTYLLVHQVSIKLILYYQTAYDLLYRSVFRWIQNPFAIDCEWTDLEELLIGSSLVGIPWGILRESFIRKLLVTLVENTPLSPQKTPLKQQLRHIFNYNKDFIHNILYEFSFFVAGRSLREIDRVYARCAGSLPHAEREAMKEMVNAVQKVDSLEKFWVTMGMHLTGGDPEEIQRNIGSYIEYLQKNVEAWKKGVPHVKLATIQVPQLSGDSIAKFGILQFHSQLDQKAREMIAEEKKKHRGFPVLNSKRKLDRIVCNYPECGKKFKCREHLFRHLKEMIDPDKMIIGHHQRHWAVEVKNKKSDTCEACGQKFESVEECHDHYVMMGTPGFKKNKENDKPQKQMEKPSIVDPYENPDECVICMDAKRCLVNVPCGHLVLCDVCGPGIKKCPICRVDVVDIVKVFYS